MNYKDLNEGTKSDIVAECQLPLFFGQNKKIKGELRVLSLFSGCGGMDIGFEGNFICHKKSVPPAFVQNVVNDNWVLLKKNRFKTVFANDILKEAQVSWLQYMRRYEVDSEIYRSESIVDLVKMQRQGVCVFPADIDVVTGGFPCQDFSVAGKRKGFDSHMSHDGKIRVEESTEETRGKLYYWMKQVIDIVKPKVFVAENVKGLVSLGDVKNIIQKDFAAAGSNGYIVLTPQVLHAGDYGVPETRERVIFIGIKKSALTPKALVELKKKEICDEYNPYPKPTHSLVVKSESLLPPVFCKDVFEGLKEPEESIDLSQINYSKAKYMGRHCQGQSEINLYGLGPTIRSEHHGNIEYRRLSVEHGGVYLDELSQGMKERRLTPRECALIQTFPPDYPFVKYKGYTKNFSLSASGAYKVIGNAVPPVLAFNIAHRLQELWDVYFK